VKGLWANKDF